MTRQPKVDDESREERCLPAAAASNTTYLFAKYGVTEPAP